MQLNERVVLLTGASRGLGRALAVALCARGARVACVARDGEVLDAAVAEAAARGGEARAFPLDLARTQECASVAAEVEQSWGPVAALVCNAGTTTAGEIADLSLADFETDWRVNFLACVAFTKAVLPGMRARGAGNLAYVLSGAALRPLPAFGSYSASKAALAAFSGSLRSELADTPLRVLGVFPGAMKTDFVARMRRVGSAPRILSPGRLAEPASVAERIVVALERDASRLAVRGPAWLVHQMDHFAPALVDRLLARRYRDS